MIKNDYNADHGVLAQSKRSAFTDDRNSNLTARGIAAEAFPDETRLQVKQNEN